MKHKIIILLFSLILWSGTAAAQEESTRLTYGDFLRDTIVEGGLHVWEFEAQAGDVVFINLQSDEFDPLLEVFFEGNLIYSDDDSGYMSDAYLETEPLEEGVYQIFVKSAFASDGGEYYLTLAGMQPIIGGDEIILNTPTVAILSEQNLDTWTLTLEATTSIYAAVRSPAQDLLLRVFDQNGELVAEDDDSGGDLNPLLESLELSAGEYQVVVEPAISVDASGASYVIELLTTANGQTIIPNTLARGVLVSVGDSAVWELTIEENQEISILARSEFFDTILTIIDPNGVVIATDDDSGTGFRSAYLELKIVDAGTYQIVVSSFGENVGLYELRVLDETES